MLQERQTIGTDVVLTISAVARFLMKANFSALTTELTLSFVVAEKFILAMRADRRNLSYLLL